MSRPRVSTPPLEPIIEVATLVELQAIATRRRQWGMRVTVTDDPTSGNNCEWVLVKGMSSTDLSDNLNWSPTTIEIGDWDMDTDAIKSVAHTLGDFRKVKHLSVVVRADADNEFVPMGGLAASGQVFIAVDYMSAGFIHLVRTTGSTLDSANYNAVGYNRGWIHLQY